MKDEIKEPNALLVGAKYADDMPWSCKYCYFWEGKKKGCMLDQCFYLEEEAKEDDGGAGGAAADQFGNCKVCPYGRHSPCIGFCIAKIDREMREKREGQLLDNLSKGQEESQHLDNSADGRQIRQHLLSLSESQLAERRVSI